MTEHSSLRVPPTAVVVGDAPAVSFEHVALAFDDQVVLRDVTFTIRQGRLTFLLGASGTGKSVILKLILGLLKPDEGVVRVGETRVDTMHERELVHFRGDIGMLFQESALFDSMSVADNVGYRLREEMRISPEEERARVEEVLGFVGLQDLGARLPSELSGGQRRRVAIARAMAAWPRLLLLDDPTSGLDPITSRSVMDEIVKLRDLQRVTGIVVTHQLPHAFYTARHEAVDDVGGVVIRPAHDSRLKETDFLVLRDGRICFAGTAQDLLRSRDPDIVTMLTGWEPALV